MLQQQVSSREVIQQQEQHLTQRKVRGHTSQSPSDKATAPGLVLLRQCLQTHGQPPHLGTAYTNTATQLRLQYTGKEANHIGAYARISQ